MTNHPAKPATYRPFTDPGPALAELDDLAAMCRDAGFTAPLRDVMARLIQRDLNADTAKIGAYDSYWWLTR